MEPVDAEEALMYAVSREMVLIYLVILVGGLLQLFGSRLFLPGLLPFQVRRLLAFVFTVVGFVAAFVGSVALLYKLVADSIAKA